ncbi:MAG: hypothetical protein C0609_08440 [Deltaproteobacteria bacterium]|nr:MAG: hypothetical protein C0609_08440 [Deltaproteobacteria bacterium]
MAASRWSEKGFSLIELMVALAIFAASFGVLISAHTGAARQEVHAQNLFTATSLAREVLTWTEVDGYPEPGDTEGDFGDNFPGYSWRRSVTDADLTGMLASMLSAYGIEGVDIPIPAGLSGVREVNISVLWEERGKEEAISLTWYAVAEE